MFLYSADAHLSICLTKPYLVKYVISMVFLFPVSMFFFVSKWPQAQLSLSWLWGRKMTEDNHRKLFIYLLVYFLFVEWNLFPLNFLIMSNIWTELQICTKEMKIDFYGILVSERLCAADFLYGLIDFPLCTNSNIHHTHVGSYNSLKHLLVNEEQEKSILLPYIC